MPIRIILTLCLCFFSVQPRAETYFQDVSLSLLRGHHYAVGDPDRTVLTLEYVNAGSWGNVFFFADRQISDNGGRETYFELQPRFQIGQFSDRTLDRFYIATQWEHSQSSDNLLLGGGVDLNFDGFQYFQLNLYRRLNEKADDNFQLTPVWAVPFSIGASQWLFDGFIDWTTETDAAASSFLFNPQLKWNVGKQLGGHDRFYLGAEYAYWHNKFGIDGVTENNLNFLIKIHF